MKSFLFFVACLFSVIQSFGQSNTNNGMLNNNTNSNENIQFNGKAEEENKKLEVPASQTMPELREDIENTKKDKEIKYKAPSNKVVSSESSKQSSNVKFSNSRKIASTQLTSRSPSAVQQKEMDEVIDFYKDNAPESFEYHYFTYTAGNYDVSLYPHLQKAQELKPANSDVVSQVAAYGIITCDSVITEKNLTQLVEIGKIESEVLSYDIDLLNSVPTNSVLLTHGFDDSYGTFYLNSVTNYRTDVTVISLDFMQSEVYRDSLQQKGFSIPASKTVDVQFLNAFCMQNESKNLFLSMTFPKPYLEPLASKLSVRGLTFAYGAKGEAVLEENELLWSKMLKNGFIYNAKTEKGKKLSSNYLPLLFYLRENYVQDGNEKGLQEVDKAIDRIGIQSNKFSKVNSMRGKK